VSQYNEGKEGSKKRRREKKVFIDDMKCRLHFLRFSPSLVHVSRVKKRQKALLGPREEFMLFHGSIYQNEKKERKEKK
jgi:hypothetical protein